jgi:transcriptional regulator with XRE-family HTH domain
MGGLILKYDDSLKMISAVRLKQLRKEKDLSHAKLSEVLSKKYDINISKDSLMLYEVADEFHSNFGRIKGMKIEYLYTLADFYNVSTDYLLGKDECKKADNREINKRLGLSDKAIEAMQGNKSLERDYFVQLLNFLLEQETLPPDPNLVWFFDSEFTKEENEAYENVLLKEFEQAYIEWEKKEYIPILSKIEDYFKMSMPQEQEVIISDNTIKAKESIRKKEKPELGYGKVVSSKYIVDYVLLDEIKDQLKQLKSRLLSKKDGK